VAAGPGVSIRTELVDARQKVGGHADIAVPDIVEFDLADLWPQFLQARADRGLQLVGIGTNKRPAGDEAVARVVAREVELAMCVRHRLPAGDDGFARRVR